MEKQCSHCIGCSYELSHQSSSLWLHEWGLGFYFTCKETEAHRSEAICPQGTEAELGLETFLEEVCPHAPPNLLLPHQAVPCSSSKASDLPKKLASLISVVVLQWPQ